MSEPNPSQTTNNKGRQRGLLILAALIVIGGGIYGAWWALYDRNYESTDDAYVSGDIVQITSEISGTVLAVHVDDTQPIKQGQVLAELDPADAQVTMQSTEADLARAVRAVRGMFSQAQELRAQIAEQEVALKRAEDDLRRRQDLLSDGAVSGEELSHSRDAVIQQQALLSSAREQLNATLVKIEGTTFDTHPQVLAAIAAVRKAALDLHRTKLMSSVSGVIAKRTVQVGQHVAPGQPLMAVVPLNDLWVDANFKEGQLKRMRAGQPVKLVSDLYGGNVIYHGKLAGLSAGSGTAFALLPAQNASGNWIKIVQRVPVRVVLDPTELNDRPLRVGLSMQVSVDVSDDEGVKVAAPALRSTPLPVAVSAGHDPQVDKLISHIISANTGNGGALAQNKAANHS